MAVGIVLCLFLGIVGHSNAQTDLHVSVNSRGDYRVEVGGQSWLRAAPTFFTAHGRHYTTADGSLVLTHTDTDAGYDVLGPWNSTTFHYMLGDSSDKIKAIFKWYAGHSLVLFGQHFVTSLKGASVNETDGVSSGFPRFYMEGGDQAGRKVELGYLAFGGIMTGDTLKTIGIWNNSSKMVSGLDSGPLVLFDKSDHALIVSPFTNFMAASVDYRSRNASAMTASWGLLGNADHVPEGFSYWTAIMYSGQGVNKLFDSWGTAMRRYYNKDRSYTEADWTNNYLSYWTDRGGYYYYLTEGHMNYEDTLSAVKKHSDQLTIPYRYIEYDSWFYPKDTLGGVTEWNATKDIFPSGIKKVWSETRWPVVGHNRWWSNETVYAKQNGGRYDFILEEKSGKGLPVSQDFWDDLMSEAKMWGLVSYEQDWLNEQFDLMAATVASLTLGKLWLHQMAAGAVRNGVFIQYCMAPSRHALTSLELPIVTQTRVTQDYLPGNDNWKIGVTSMFAHALGLAPYKDNFWTTRIQPGNVYNGTEDYASLHVAAAALSTGPVAPSDKIGCMNKELIMRSCNKEGLVLKPSKPITSIDKQLLLTAFSGFRGEVWSTYSRISGVEFGVILGADFSPQDKVTVTPGEAGLANSEFPVRAITYSPKGKPNIIKFNDDHPVILKGCTKEHFCLVYTSPVLAIGSREVLILGETEKFVHMSPQRITGITVTSSGVIINISGVPGEVVTMAIRVDSDIKTIKCTIGVSGTNALSVLTSTCTESL